MVKRKIESMDSFRGEKADDLNIEPGESIEVGPAESVHGAVRPEEAARDGVEGAGDKKIELWMQNIREFIRKIDVDNL